MSAFLVQPDTINAVCKALEPREMSACEDLDKLGVDLLHLNYRALGARYGDDVPDKNSLSFRFRPKMYSQFALLKALRCLRYQCAEGNIPNDSLFQRLTDRINAMAIEIIDGLPAYKNTDSSH
jgi:hypothetical protein